MADRGRCPPCALWDPMLPTADSDRTATAPTQSAYRHSQSALRSVWPFHFRTWCLVTQVVATIHSSAQPPAAATSATAATTPIAAAAAVAIAVAAATAVAAAAVATPIPSSKSATPESPAANQWLPSVCESGTSGYCAGPTATDMNVDKGGLVVLFVPSMLWVLCVVPPKLGIKVHYRAHPNIDNPLAFRSKAIVRRGL